MKISIYCVQNTHLCIDLINQDNCYMKERTLQVCMIVMFILSSSLHGFAQTPGSSRNITGRVADESGTAIPNASITVKETNIGTTTNEEGRFTLSVPVGSNVLVVSSIGFTTQEVNIGSQNNLQIILKLSTGNLNEVVVVGYGTSTKRDLTGSITTINADDFVQGVVTSPEQLIAGKAAGVQITSNSGAPGSGSTIRIRGGSSLNASNDPLIVVDGVPLSPGGISGSPNAMSLINPNDIESVNILKDAAASAIYGSRASNGVIIITTKKGTSGKPQFNFSSQFAMAKNTNKVEVLTGDQFRELIMEKGNENQKGYLGTENTDWQDQIYQEAFSQDLNLNVSGSVDNKLPYRVSLGYLNQDGVLKTGNLKRGSAGINLSPRLFDNHLKIDVNIKGALSKSRFANEGAIGAAVIFDPTQPVKSGNDKFGGFFEWINPSTNNPDGNAPRNPVGLLEMRDDKSNVLRSIGNIQLDYKFHFLPDLRANLNLGYDISEGKGTVYVPAEAASQFLRGGTDNEYHQERNNKLLEFYLNYNKSIPSINSNIDVLAGYSYQDFKTTNYNFADISATGDTITTPNFPFDIPQNTLLSYYGRLNYSYNSKYLLTLSLRRDGSSRFSPDNRWGIFPAAAFAWNMAEEEFLKGTGISNLKLRLGYGVTGQQEGIGNYDYISYYNLSSTTAMYQLGNTYYQMYRPGGYYANRKWEETETYNAGLDFGFLKGRINGSVDVYYKKTTDLLNEINQPAGTNFSNRIIANVGSMENRGIELNLNTDIINNSGFIWDVNFNITYNKNKITKLTIAPDPSYAGNKFGGISGGTGNVIQINSVGHPRASFYVYQQVYDETGRPLESLFVNRNGDGTINEGDLYQYKNPDPDVFMGLSTNFTIGKFSAGLVFRSNIGNYVYNNVYSNLGRYSTIIGLGTFLNNTSINYLDTEFEGTDVKQMLSDYYVHNASFLKMDNINLSYNVGTIGKDIGLRITGNVQNVFVITKYKGIDPEINGGIDNNFYPRPRNFVIGLHFNF